MRVDCDVNVNGFIACGVVQINTYFMWLGTRIMGTSTECELYHKFAFFTLLYFALLSHFRYNIDRHNQKVKICNIVSDL